MTARGLIAAGAAVALLGSFLTYVDFSTGAALVDGQVVFGEELTLWELAKVIDVALLVLCLAAAGLALAGRLGPAALAAGAVAGLTVLAFVEQRGNGVPSAVGMWLTAAGGALTIPGAVLVARDVRPAPPGFVVPLLIGAALAVAASMFLPYSERGSEARSYWEHSFGSDAALLLLAIAFGGLALYRLAAPAALAAAALGADLVLSAAESLAARTPEELVGFWLLSASGLAALVGAALVLISAQDAHLVARGADRVEDR